MQPNGGFFGSMMPQGASSFMPSQGSAQSMIGGIQGSPESFTSPPMGGGLMAALAALSKMSGQGQGGMPNGASALPPGATLAPGASLPGAPPSPPAGAASPGGQPNIMQMLQGMPPDQLKGILQRLGIGGGAPAPAMQ